MQALLKFSQGSRLAQRVSRQVRHLADPGLHGDQRHQRLVRKVFNFSSNAYLEVQWYLFAAAFLLAAGYTLLNGEHVKIDVISSRLSKRTQIWIDVIGFTLFLTPVCLAILWYRHAVLPAGPPLRARCRPTPAA